MSWLARSIANSLNFDDADDGGKPSHSEIRTISNSVTAGHLGDDPTQSPTSPGRGVKDDISELTETLTRQIWGVASFLAPPPRHHLSELSNPSIPDPSVSDVDEASSAICGMRSDFLGSEGKPLSRVPRLNHDAWVPEFEGKAWNDLRSEEDNGKEAACDWMRCAVGVTDEVVAFARDIANHPETWLDFPLPEDEEDEDFDLSDSQQEHIWAVEHLVPQLAAMRIELCLGYMSEGWFWKIYFVFLHPRLDKQASELLITPQIGKARALLTKDLHHQTNEKQEGWSNRDIFYSKDINSTPFEDPFSVKPTVQFESQSNIAVKIASSTMEDDFERVKHIIASAEIPIIEKSIVEEGPNNQKKVQHSYTDPSSDLFEDKDEDDDDWLKEDGLEIVGIGGNSIHIGNVEDVSFSDLEDNGDDIPVANKKVIYSAHTSTKAS